jgi:hypothetical protein
LKLSSEPILILKEENMKNYLMTVLLSALLIFSTACNRADNRVENQIEDKMKNANLDRVDVSVDKGTATLNGEVNNDMQKAQAEVITRETPGVNNVKDNLRVVYKEDSTGEKGLITRTPTDNQPPTGGGNYSDKSYGNPQFYQQPGQVNKDNQNQPIQGNQPVVVEEQKRGGYNNPVVPGAQGNPLTKKDQNKNDSKDQKKNDSNDSKEIQKQVP